MYLSVIRLTNLVLTKAVVQLCGNKDAELREVVWLPTQTLYFACHNLQILTKMVANQIL